MSDLSSTPPGADGPPVVLFLCVRNRPLADDPFGQSVEHMRPVRDEIGRRVRELLAGLGVV